MARVAGDAEKSEPKIADRSQRLVVGIVLEPDGGLSFLRVETHQKLKSLITRPDALIADGICRPEFSQEDAHEMLVSVRKSEAARITRPLAKWKAEDEQESEEAKP